MTITLLLRAPGTGHSLEEIFEGIGRELAQLPGVTVNVVRMPHISRGLRSVWQNLRFVAKLRETTPTDVFHVTGDVHYAALVLPPSRTVLTIHDSITLTKNRNRPFRYALFWLLWYYWPISRAAVVTVVSDSTRHRLRRQVGRVSQKAKVIPNAVDPVFRYNPQPFQRACPVLLQLGTAPHKNLTRVIDGIHGLSCTLIVVGPLTDGTAADLLRRGIVYEQYADLSRAEVAELYNRCDIVMFVSTYEGFGLPILEANAVGRAVITADRSPMREVAGGAAVLVDPMKPAAIRSGLLRVIQDDDYRHELIAAGRQNAARYSLERVARDYFTLYQSMPT